MAYSLSTSTSSKLLLPSLVLAGLLGLTACQPSSDAQDEANNQTTEASNSAETSQSASK